MSDTAAPKPSTDTWDAILAKMVATIKERNSRPLNAKEEAWVRGLMAEHGLQVNPETGELEYTEARRNDTWTPPRGYEMPSRRKPKKDKLAR